MRHTTACDVMLTIPSMAILIMIAATFRTLSLENDGAGDCVYIMDVYHARDPIPGFYRFASGIILRWRYSRGRVDRISFFERSSQTDTFRGCVFCRCRGDCDPCFHWIGDSRFRLSRKHDAGVIQFTLQIHTQLFGGIMVVVVAASDNFNRYLMCLFLLQHGFRCIRQPSFEEGIAQTLGTPF